MYNSASLVGPGGDWSARYDKVHLVPFGEYTPFPADVFVSPEDSTKEVGDFYRRPGARAARRGREASSEFSFATNPFSPMRSGSSSPAVRKCW